jgi:hypothetical protein
MPQHKMQVALALSDGSKAYLGVHPQSLRPRWYRGTPAPLQGSFGSNHYFCAVSSANCPKESRLRVWLDPSSTPTAPAPTMEKALEHE